MFIVLRHAVCVALKFFHTYLVETWSSPSRKKEETEAVFHQIPPAEEPVEGKSSLFLGYDSFRCETKNSTLFRRDIGYERINRRDNAKFVFGYVDSQASLEAFYQAKGAVTGDVGIGAVIAGELSYSNLKITSKHEFALVAHISVPVRSYRVKPDAVPIDKLINQDVDQIYLQAGDSFVSEVSLGYTCELIIKFHVSSREMSKTIQNDLAITGFGDRLDGTLEAHLNKIDSSYSEMATCFITSTFPTDDNSLLSVSLSDLKEKIRRFKAFKVDADIKDVDLIEFSKHITKYIGRGLSPTKNLEFTRYFQNIRRNGAHILFHRIQISKLLEEINSVSEIFTFYRCSPPNILKHDLEKLLQDQESIDKLENSLDIGISSMQEITWMYQGVLKKLVFPELSFRPESVPKYDDLDFHDVTPEMLKEYCLSKTRLREIAIEKGNKIRGLHRSYLPDNLFQKDNQKLVQLVSSIQPYQSASSNTYSKLNDGEYLKSVTITQGKKQKPRATSIGRIAEKMLNYERIEALEFTYFDGKTVKPVQGMIPTSSVASNSTTGSIIRTTEEFELHNGKDTFLAGFSGRFNGRLTCLVFDLCHLHLKFYYIDTEGAREYIEWPRT